MENARIKTVFVGLSGGVDSSVAAVRLQQAGYNVVGVFIKVWHPDWLVCNWEQERLDAMRVAAKLNIPFLTCDAEAAYKDGVAEYFITEYKAGRTPNPDVMCNQQVKFGAFLEFAVAHGADFVATGHYAQNIPQISAEKTVYQLHRGIDTNKDQSYFLWTLTQAQLAKILLPVGASTKDVIRQEAAAAGLLTADKKDSQGVCFLGHIDIAEFLSHYIELKPGAVLDETGAVIGEHQGAFVYTTGQRHGFFVHNSQTASQAHYVMKRDIAANTITVSTTPPRTPGQTELTLEGVNYIATTLTAGETVELQTRYRQTPSTVTIAKAEVGSVEVTFTHEAESFSVGQSGVLYQGNRCIGGGIVS